LVRLSSLQKKEANFILNQFKEDSTAWTHCGKILNSQQASVDTKFIALNILTEAINTQWNIFSEEQKLEVRKFLVQMT